MKRLLGRISLALCAEASQGRFGLPVAEDTQVNRILRICFALLLVAGSTALAAAQEYTPADNGSRIIARNASQPVVPAIRDDAKLKTLFSNLSAYKYGTYFCCVGYSVLGPDNPAQKGVTIWVAVPFIPSANVKLTKVEAAVGHYEGTNSVAIWLAADASGLPGDTLAGPVDVDSLRSFPGCCTLAVAKFKNVPLAKGAQYWIVVGTDPNSIASYNTWAWNITDMRSHPYAGLRRGNWARYNGVLPAIGIFGKQ
jgi:hypothetical protein